MGSLTIVVGPPCAGKSTYVAERRSRDDVVIDYDLLAAALGATSAHEAPDGISEVARAARRAAVRTVLDGITSDTWLLHTNPQPWQLASYERAGAEFVLLDPGMDECLARAGADDRPDTTKDAIRAWYEAPPAVPIEKGQRRMHTKDFAARVKAAGSDDGLDEGSFTALVSVFGNEDAYGDVVAKGAFTDTLKAWANKGDPIPVIWSHDWADPYSHIGTVSSAEETDDGLQVSGQLDLEDNPTAKQVYKLLKGRRVTQFSFAFDIDDAGFTEKDGQDVFELRKLSLFEVGPCLVGANQETDLVAVKADALARRSKAEGDSIPQQLLEKIKKAHNSLGEVIKAADSGSGGGDGDDGNGGGDSGKAAALAGVKGAIGAGSGPSETSDAEWDGPANKAKLSNDAGADTYRKAFAWQDPDGDPDTKDAYKFIHHFIGDDGAVGAASTQACVTGIGVLNGGRGGSNVPEADRRGVFNHLAKHLKDAGADVPELQSSSSPDGGEDSRSRTDDAAGAKQEAGQPGASAVANDPASHGGSSAEQPQGTRSAKAAARLRILELRSG